MNDFSRGAAFVDGKLVPVSEAKISLLDLGFLHSDATYDVVHVWRGKFFRLEDHLDRFFAGMEKLRLTIPHTRDELRLILADCVKASGMREAYVEMITTRGLAKPGSRDPRDCRNQFFAFAVPFVQIVDPKVGMRIAISEKMRIPAGSVDPRVKNYHWLDLVMGQFEAFDRGAESAVVVDCDGNLMEGPGFNVFAVKGSVVSTPGAGVLHGITRKTVIELAHQLGFSVLEGDLDPGYARSADELFASSTAGGIMPITEIDGVLLNGGAAGPVTQKLIDAYWSLHDQPAYSLEVEYGVAGS